MEERIEGIDASDLLDEEEGSPPPRIFRSGRGRLTASPGRKELEPELVSCEDGRLGWRVRLPGTHPLATPAVVRGRVFLGGGFGSHEFYAFDAATGNVQWRLRTRDDGPTAAAIDEDRVAFNTESCTVYVAEAATGKVLWERWLGDPLMAQPAIHRSTVFMAHPDKARKHRLAAFDLGTGKPRWQAELVADLISAPVAVEGSLYGATIDGSVYRIDLETGKRIWSIDHGATSAPWVHRGRIFVSLREEVKRGRDRFTAEGLDTVSFAGGHRGSPQAFSRRRAEYLRYQEAAPMHAAYALHDAKVGFAQAPLSAKLHLAQAHLGLGHVASLWSFQGSRPEVFDDGIFVVLDDLVEKLDLETRRPLWRSRITADGQKPFGRALNPPAVSASRIYLTSSLGDLVALDRHSGEEMWALNVGSPILSQPSLGGGKVFLGTMDGVLHAFESGDPEARWPMWGGGPGHNGPRTE